MTTGRIIVAVLLLGALGVLIKLVLFLLGIYQPSPANIRPLYPDAQTAPAQPAAPMAPAAPQPAPEPQPQPQPAPRAMEPKPAPAEAQPLVTPEAQPEPEPKAVNAAPGGDSEGTQSAKPGGMVRYVVQPGDTLWAIARQSCGAGARYEVLYRNNSGHIKNPHRIWPQQVIEIPGDCR